VLESISARLSNGSNRLSWLCGSPGTGKTAIAKSIAIDLHGQRRLAASFFFDKSGKRPGTASLEMFVTTIASQLADFCPLYRSELARILSSNRAVLNEPLPTQLDRLILEPFLSLAAYQSPLEKGHVIVLDGLDECGGPKDLRALVALVVKLSELPASFQIFVSCRPEKEVLDALNPRLTPDLIEDLDSVDDNTLHDDILVYINAKLADIPSDTPGSWPPPRDRVMEFARRCHGLFVLAEVRIRLIEEESRSALPLEVFDYILASTKDLEPTIEAEYARIIRRAYIDGIAESKFKLRTYQRYRTLVGVFITAQLPLTLDAMSALVGMDIREVQAALKPLSAVLRVMPGDIVRAFHATFSEYLLGKEDSPSDYPICFGSPQHDVLAMFCLSTLNAKLEHDRAWVHQDGGAMGRDALDYAFWSWALHITESPQSVDVREMLEQFMANKWKIWLEHLRKQSTAGSFSSVPAWYSVSLVNLITIVDPELLLFSEVQRCRCSYPGRTRGR
jgi:hypothetical protein